MDDPLNPTQGAPSNDAGDERALAAKFVADYKISSSSTGATSTPLPSAQEKHARKHRKKGFRRDKRPTNSLPVMSADDELHAASIALRNENAKAANREETIRLRNKVATAAIWFVSIQIGASNVFFGWYLFHNKESVDHGIMLAWLTASVVEIIGIMGIVAISLFPGKAKRNCTHASS